MNLEHQMPLPSFHSIRCTFRIGFCICTIHSGYRFVWLRFRFHLVCVLFVSLYFICIFFHFSDYFFSFCFRLPRVRLLLFVCVLCRWFIYIFVFCVVDFPINSFYVSIPFFSRISLDRSGHIIFALFFYFHRRRTNVELPLSLCRRQRNFHFLFIWFRSKWSQLKITFVLYCIESDGMNKSNEFRGK